MLFSVLSMLPLFTMLVDRYIIILGVWLDSFSFGCINVGFACQVVRGFHTFFSSFRAHLCWGGGGSVANVGYGLVLVQVSNGRRVVMVTCEST